MPTQDPTQPEQPVTDADLRLQQADAHHQSTEGLLETIIQQNDTNNPVPVLEHILVSADETKKAIEKSAIPSGTVEQFMKTFTETVEKLKGEPGKDAVVDYEKVVAESVPKVEEAIKKDTALLDSFKAKPEDVAKELQSDTAFVDSLKAPEVDPAEVAHILRNNPFFMEEVTGEDGEPGETPEVDYAKIVSLLKGDVDFVALTKGEPGAIVRGKTTGAKELMDYISSRQGDERLSYNSLKDTPNFELYRGRGGGAGYLRELSDVDITGLAVNQSIKWNGTRWVVYTPSSGSTGTVTSVASADGSIVITNPTTTPDLSVVKAPKLTTGRTIGITGDITYTSPSFDGTGNVTAAATLATVNVSPGTYTLATITVDGKGRVTAASNGAGGGSGITRSVNVISTPTTAAATAAVDYVYLVSGTTTLTLPTAVGNTNRYTVTNTGSNTVTVATTGGQTINGSATATLPIANMSLDLISDGANWHVE